MTKKIILKGIGASTGTAKGKVNIVNTDEDFKSFKNGDILVTKITDPSMVSIMFKASAIITDIGGITSHPAIVSRELGTPCIVSTKNATSKLKNDQLIEVDGKKGEVYEVNNKTFDKDCDDMLNSFNIAMSKMDFSTFEISSDFSKLDPQISEVWTQKIFAIISETKKQNLSKLEIAKLIGSPSKIRSLIFFDLFMASIGKIKPEEKKEIVDFYIGPLKAICHTDPFALNQKNIIHSPEEINNLYSNLSDGSPEIAKKLGRLINACYHLSHSLYGDMNPQILYENYGPYVLKDSLVNPQVLIIKEFKNLRPFKIWSGIKTIPLNKIKIINLYKDIEFEIDSLTHTNYKGDIIHGLKKYSLEVDDKYVSYEEIDNISEIVENYTKIIWNKFKSLNEDDFKLLYLYQKSYNYIDLVNKLELNWLPTEKMKHAIINNKEKIYPDFKTTEEANEYFLKIIDPRNDFN